MSLEDVIARLETASVGHRDLDYAIHRAVYGERMIGAGIRSVPGGGWWHPEHGKIAPPEHYTTSLDAALTLLPEGWWLQHLGQNLAGWSARVETQGCSIPPGMMIGPRSPAPALALCIACLRARATDM